MRVFDHWDEVERLFHAALEQDPADRSQFLSRICTDPDLLAEVSSLLEAHEKGGSLLDRPPNKAAAEFLEQMGAREQSLVGSSFDHYEITGVLGEGMTGKVYLARDSRLMRKVALKVLPAPHVQSLERLRRFAQEARVASALNHPNIITVYDYGQAFSSYYIATEYVEGRTLRALIREGVAFGDALEIATQMASAFAAAHDAGIIHRDIKPENIMVRADGLVKVLDFGLAKLSSQSESMTSIGETPATVPGAVMGTFSYMSPEQARGQDLDPRTDIFSFGIVLYEMLAGRRPFSGDTLPDLLTSLVGSDPPPLSDFLPAAPQGLEAILACALARDRDQRYQSFESLLSDLTSVRMGLEGGESPPIRFRASVGPPSTKFGSSERLAAAPVQTSEQPRETLGDPGLSRFHTSPVRLKRLLVIPIGIVTAIASYVVINRVISPFKKGSSLQVDRVKKLTYDGGASIGRVSVSPDGKHFAYVRGSQLSVLTMPISDQENPVTLNTVSCPNCGGVTFSTDGSYAYYVGGDSENGALYRMPVAKHQPEKVLEDVNRSISFSPDGSRFVFVRNSEHALLTASADGTDERTLASDDHSGDLWLYPAWSPDGKIVACGVLNPATRNEELWAVGVADGSKRLIRSSIKWARIRNVAWASSKELVLNAAGDQGQASGLWLISYPAGEAHKMTTDLSEYYGVSLTADSRTLISVRVDYNMNLYVGVGSDPAAARKVNLGPLNNYGFMGLCWTTDQKVIYSAGAIGSKDLYLYDPSGPDQGYPLTSNAGDNTYPCVTPDNKYIVFASDRDGSLSIWRVDLDGRNPEKLAAEGLRPACLLNDRWVVFQVTDSAGRTSLRKVSIDGATPAILATPEGDAENAAVSPDGRRVAFVLKRSGDSPPQLAVSGGDWERPDTYDLPREVRLPIIRWRDAETLLYIDQWGEGSKIWEQRLDHHSSPQPIKFSSQVDFSSVLNFDWANGRLILSAGHNTRSDVVELTLSE